MNQIVSNATARLTKIETWTYGLLNATVVGGASSVSSWLGMVAAKSIGMDVPTLNLKAVGVIFLSGAAVKFFGYLSQGLPKLDDTQIIEKP